MAKRTPDFWPSLIRELRTERGWSEYRLCDEADISRTTLRKIEAGGNYSVETLEKLLAVFGYELDALPRKGDSDAL